MRCRKVFKFGAVIKPHSFLLFWPSSGRQDIQALQPLDHFLFNCHPCISSRSKVNDSHHQAASSLKGVGKKKCENKLRTALSKKRNFLQKLYLTRCSTWCLVMPKQMQVTLREKTRVCLLCWPVAPGLSATLPPQITTRRVMKCSRASNSNSNELSVSFPWEQLSHERVAD